MWPDFPRRQYTFERLVRRRGASDEVYIYALLQTKCHPSFSLTYHSSSDLESIA